ncbi:DUF2062 domain-containing protein [Rhizobium ruizarguesonis]|uniref:DUF2062 domain-containing protein n=1 Tax=Rhizobium ruizarguesonis TaxID=2081791 RepID=UPI001FE1F9E8|nr:DUF2062 domain-containing protein [Rhizobium ruizarguesonis]
MKATPHAVAAGVAAGVAVSCTPFLGFHFIMAFCLAFILRGNMIAAALGTGFGNPLTFPLIFAAAYRIGIFLLGRAPERVGEANLFTLLGHLDFAPLWHPILKPILVGGLPLAALCGAVFYVLTWQGAFACSSSEESGGDRKFQMRRRREDPPKNLMSTRGVATNS